MDSWREEKYLCAVHEMKLLICKPLPPFGVFWERQTGHELGPPWRLSQSGQVNAFQEIRSTSALNFLPESGQVALKIVKRTDGLCSAVSKLRHQVPAYVIGLPSTNNCNWSNLGAAIAIKQHALWKGEQDAELGCLDPRSWCIPNSACAVDWGISF